MTEIDERIVAMHFDNKQFEKGAKQTIETLEQLKESCDFEGSAESLNELTKSIREIDLGDAAKKASELGAGLKSIFKTSFRVTTAPIRKLGSALGGLANNVKAWFGIDLSHDIQQSIKKGLQALTIEPVSAGWDEYEMKMDSIKTIMSGTAKEFAGISDEKHMGAVKETLEQLNRYADETIYSFKDMTANIGKFTNAGVKLDTAAKSMMGISNLAAQAGQGTQQASMAMYNFSQAMGLGYVELRDWRSIENANMATMEFKETLVELGVAMGTLKKDSKGVIKTAVKGEKEVEVTAEKLRESLNKKWLTNDVLSSALEIYSGGLSVKEIQQRLKVSKEQAQRYYDIGKAAKDAATQVRTFSKMWDALKEAAQSGWAVSFEHIFGNMDEATRFWSKINERISGWLTKGADDRNKILEGWRGLVEDANGKKMKKGRDGRQDLIDTIHLLFDTIEKVGQAITKAWESIFGKLTGKKLQNFTANVRNFAESMSNWLGDIDKGNSRISKFSKILRGLFAILKGGLRIIRDVATAIGEVVMPLLDPIIDFCVIIADAITDLVNGKFDFNKFISKFAKLGISVKAGLQKSWEVITGWFGKIFGNGEGLFSGFTIEGPIGEWFTSISTTFNTWVEKFKKFIHWDDISETITNGWNKVVSFFRGDPIGWKVDGDSAPVPVEYSKSGFAKLIDDVTMNLNDELNRLKVLIHWDEISSWFTEKWEGIINFFKGDKDNPNAKTGFETWAKSVARDFNNAVKSLKALIHWDDIEAFFLGEKRVDRLTGETVRAKSEFSNIFDGIVKSVSDFWKTVEDWSGWTGLGDFFTSIHTSIIDFVSPGENGSPSQLQQWFSSVREHVNTFIRVVAAWKGWKTFGDFFVSIKDSIVKFVTPGEDGSPSQLKQTFDEIVGYVGEWYKSVTEWEGWTSLWDVLDTLIITPIRRFFNWVVHGDADYSEKKTSAHTPIGVIASGFASDVSLLKKGSGESGNILTQIASSLSSSFTEITSAFDIFNPDENGEVNPIKHLQDWFDSLGTTLSEIWSPVGTAITQLAADISSGVTTIRDAINQIVQWITESPWDQWFTEINGKLQEFGGTLAIFNAGGLLGGLGKAAKGFGILGKDWGEATKLFASNGFKFDFGEFGKNLGESAKAVSEGFKDLTKNAGDFLKNPKEFGKKIGNIIGGYREGQVTSVERVQTFANVLIELAGAVGIMAWSIMSLLDKIKEINDLEGTVDGETKKSDAIWERLDHIFVVMGTALGVTELFATINAFGKQKGASVASSLVGFAAAIASMTWALHSLVELCSSATEGQLIQAGAILAAFATVITAFNFLTNKSSEWLGTTDKNGFWKAGKTSSGGLIGFAVAIEAMVLAVNQLVGTVKNTQFDEAQEAVLILAELTALISAFEVAKNWSQGFLGSKTAGTGLISFALAIEAMIHAVGKIAEAAANEDVDMAVVQGTIAAIASLITGFELVKNLTSGKYGKVELGNGKTGLIGFALAIEALVLAVKQLASVPKDKLAQGKNALSDISSFINSFVVLKELGGLIGSTFSTSGGFSYKGGNNKTGLLGFVATITALLSEIVIIGNLPQTGINNGVKIMEQVSTMVNTFQALMSLENFTEKFGSVGQKVAATVSLGLFVAGLAGILWAIAELSKTTTPDQIAAFTSILSGLWPNLTALESYIAVMSALPNGSGWLGGAKAAINVVEFIGILMAAAYGIGQWKIANPKLFEDLDNSLGSLFDLVGSLIGKAQGSKEASRLTEFVTGLNTASEESGNLDLENLTKLADAVAIVKTISENLPTEPTIIDQWFKGKQTMSGFAENMTNLGYGLRNFNGALKGVNIKGEEIFGGVLDPDLFQRAGIAIEAIFAVMKDFKDEGLNTNDIDRFGWFLDYLGNKESGFLNNNSLLMQFAELGKAFSSGWNGIEFNTDLDTSSFIDALALSIQSESAQDKFKQALIISLQGALNGLGDLYNIGVEKATTVVEETTSNISSTVEEKTPEIANSAEALVNSWLAPILDGLSNEGNNAATDLSEGVKSGSGSMNTAGYYLDAGLANGISTYSYLPTNAMLNLTQSLTQIPANQWQIHSPSKVFENFGRFNMMGLALGTENNEGLAISAVQQMGNRYYQAMQEALAPVDAILNDDFTFTPVITPIVDMTNLRNGANAVDGLFNSRYGVNTTLPSFTRNAQIPEINGTISGNSQMINAIISRMDQMSEELHNMKIVLNTGALVGATVNEYDRALGQRASKARRG